MPFDRRTVLSTGIFSAGLAAVAAGPRAAAHAAPSAPSFAPREGSDQTAELQAAIDAAAERGAPLTLGAGTYRLGPITLRPGTRLSGAGAGTVLAFAGGATFISARDAPGLRLEHLTIDGNGLGIDAAQAVGLIALDRCADFTLADVSVRGGLLNGIALAGCSGTIRDCTVARLSQAGILSLDATGLTIAHCTVSDCGNNGIQIWRSSPGEDGTILAANRIHRIETKGGGTGQNGNGINVFRASGVIASGNRIEDCAYSAIRGNAASNIQMTGNTCLRIGEVALYAEFAFEGALIANNVVDDAASGIAVTNFNEGGRLAVVTGNLIRNLFRREHEPVDKRGIGIGIEADTAVSGNVIENAPTAGISAGWGPYLRDVSITGNVIRKAGVGILLSSDPGAGACLVSNNMISGTKDGAIRVNDHGTPVGPDLATDAPPAGGRVAISGNLAV
jgi:uncharacterized secreted repeat protein (TIGR03808 family)